MGPKGTVGDKNQRYIKGETGRGGGPKPPDVPSTARGKRRRAAKQAGKTVPQANQ